MVHECTGGGEHQHQYALSGNGDLDHRATPIADARLSLIRYPACRAADKVAACGVLWRALAHPAGALPQTHSVADHARPVHYELPLPPRVATDERPAKSSQLYIHAPRGRAGRSIDDSTERFVETTRMGAST